MKKRNVLMGVQHAAGLTFVGLGFLSALTTPPGRRTNWEGVGALFLAGGSLMLSGILTSRYRG